MRKLSVAAQVEAGVELHQVFVAALVLRQQDQGRRIARTFARARVDISQIDLAADDRLHPGARGGDRKFQRREQVVGVGHGDCGHAHRLAQAGKLLEPHRPFEQGVFGMGAQVDELGDVVIAAV